ncbi:MAG TPA: tetratricopeptide repeat protein [Pyrinomonadaceae bacterium]|nr:tetratricopeptide repeat protein [Pyrinomonadaceae bacterium]
MAKELEKAGEYQAAIEALSEFWDGASDSIQLKGLDDRTSAQLLVRAGCLAGWQGSADPSPGSQERAKNLITRGIALYEGLHDTPSVAEARADLAVCYWREGGFDEARITLSEALSLVSADDIDLRASILVRAGIVEVDSRRLSEAIRIYNEAAVLVEKSSDHNLHGTFHNSFGLALRRMADIDNLEAYVDRALVEYAAASFHFEQAGNTRYLARVENNLGFLFHTIGRYDDAHTHLDRARQLFLELRDTGTVAQVDETRARTFLAQGRYLDAERLIRSAVRVLERGDEQAILAEALTTYGIVKAKLGKFVRARQLLDRAIEVAETCGDPEGSGRAKLSIIEELIAQTSPDELGDTYEAAADLLKRSQDPSTTIRLIKCALIVIEALRTSTQEAEPALSESWDNFSVKKQVRAFEKSLIERALRDSGGAVTKAAHLLGFKHHQSLISLINSRHRDLLGQRSAVRPRRSHLFSKSRKVKRKAAAVIRQPSSQIRILHVEDQKPVADQVSGLLTAENWKVEWCTDVDTALRMLTGDEHYDVLLIGNTVNGLSAFELAERARKITHRRRTPIIMMSAGDFEKYAWRAGMDAFLKQPEQVNELTNTVNRLLREGSKSR